MAKYYKEYHSKYYRANAELLKEKARLRYLLNPHDRSRSSLLGLAKQRAKRTGLPFDLYLEDITIPEFCPVLKVKLESKTRFAPSLDKIVPSKGYVKGNVWVISKLANQMKSDASILELRRFAEWAKTL
jgi:hypothetical protein